jgi:hypothetical protein
MASIQAANGASKSSVNRTPPPRTAAATRASSNPKSNALKSKSRVTNGRGLFVERDMRGPWTRRFKDVLAEIISDLGGPDSLSEGQRQLARRATTLSLMCEKMEGEMADGNEIDLHRYGQLTDRIGRTFHRLGLKRQARDVTPTLGQLIRADQDAERRRLANGHRRKHGDAE